MSDSRFAIKSILYFDNADCVVEQGIRVKVVFLFTNQNQEKLLQQLRMSPGRLT